MVDFMSWFDRESEIGTSDIPKWLKEASVNDEVRREVIVKKRIVYIEKSDYSVYLCEDDDGATFEISGTFPMPLLEGQTYSIKGKVSTYRGKKQVHCMLARLEKPTTKHGIIAFLKTLKGIDKRAEILYDIYGSKIVDILLKDPMKVAKEVKGIGKKSVLSWNEQLQALQEEYRVLSALLDLGITLRQAKKLMERYGLYIVDLIEENPYFLSDVLDGYNFVKCDEIAQKIGCDPKSKHRIQYGILYVLKEAMNEGHCYLPKDELIKKAQELMNYKLTANEMKQLVFQHRGKTVFDYPFRGNVYTISYETLLNHWSHYLSEKTAREKAKYRYPLISLSNEEIENQIAELEKQMKLIIKDDAVYLFYLYQAELDVFNKIMKILQAKQEEFLGVQEDLQDYLKEKGYVLEERQEKAVIEFASKTGGMYILNGSAGCGKTFALNIILAILEQQYHKIGRSFRVKIFAPTGKASKVAKRATGRDASTVHRGLGYRPDLGFFYNEDNPLEADCVVLDESSMLDILLAKNLFDAIPPECKVIFLGDTKQLPPVGAGNVLHDLIDAGKIPVITLNVVKRQAEHSGIIRNANRIINGEMITSCKDTKDAYVIQKRDVFEVQEAIIRSIKRLMEGKKYTLEDIQVLCPQKNGEIGTYVMNWIIQQAFNPNPPGEKVLNRNFKKKHPYRDEMIEVPLYFQVGDKVMHISNNYKKPWYKKDEFGNYIEDPDRIGITNGECGIIEDIRKEKIMGTTQVLMIVRYEDGYVMYYDSFEELDHAYAMTIHKSQGSQWPAVIMPIMMENYIMLDNSIFYTGYTRAKEFNCVIGQQEAIAYAIKTFKHRQRYTSLKEHFMVNAS